MTDRLNALLVILDHDIRDDDAEGLINAIKQLKHVIGVQPQVADFPSAIAQVRARQELAEKLWQVLYPPKGQV